MIEAKIILDSISPQGVRLTTFELKYPRFILAEFNTHRTFCLDGDSIIEFDLPTAKIFGKKRLYKMRIRDFVNKWHNGVKEHKTPSYKGWDITKVSDENNYSAKELGELIQVSCSNIRTYCRNGKLKFLNIGKSRSDDYVINGKDFRNFVDNVLGKRTFPIKKRLEQMHIRQLNEETNEIVTATVKDCCYSGVKEVFKVNAGNYSVSGSKDHLILTTTGWKKIGDIVSGVDYILCSSKTVSDKKDDSRYRIVNGVNRSVWQKQIKHKKVLEQEGKCYDCGVSFSKETGCDTHHVIPVHEDLSKCFDEGNVVVLCKKCHTKRHNTQDWQKEMDQKLRAIPVLVDSIITMGERDTYDLEISGEFANFIANGVVVHNSRNSASSRAIPVKKMIKDIINDPVIPVFWGKNQAGMQAKEELSGFKLKSAQFLWKIARYPACGIAYFMTKIGLHKQIANRIIEPWMWTKTIVTATEWDNFFELRVHEDAQPEIYVLATRMYGEYINSKPTLIDYGEWHLPYLIPEERQQLPKDVLIKISAARCARVSYLTHCGNRPDTKRDLILYNDLVGAVPIHGSPTEHQATPNYTNGFDKNFKGWHQHRADIEHKFNKGE